MFGSFGVMELVLILFIVLIIFGAGKLPQLGEGLGKAIKGFKKSVHEADEIEAQAQAQLTATPQGQQAPGAQPATGTGAAPAVPTVDGKPITPPPPPKA